MENMRSRPVVMAEITVCVRATEENMRLAKTLSPDSVIKACINCGEGIIASPPSTAKGDPLWCEICVAKLRKMPNVTTVHGEVLN